MNGFFSELVKLRAYRLTAWLLPMTTAAMTSAASFFLVGAADLHRAGELGAVTVDGAASAPGSGTFFSGLLLGIFATIVITTDHSSGVMNLSLMAESRRSLFRSKLAIGFLAAGLVSLAGSAGVGLVAVLVLPADLFWRVTLAWSLWVNLLGAFACHLTWAAMAMAAAWVLRTSARALGVLIGLVLVPPASSVALRVLDQQWAADAVDLLPAGMMNAATLTGADATAALPPALASGCLLAWCAVCACVGWAAFRHPR